MLAKKIGIDLGTVNTLVYLPGRGIVVNEPSVVALNTDDNSLVAIGTEAEDMLGRTPEALLSHRPLRDGVIADFRVTQAMLKHYINQALGRLRLIRPDVMVSIPAGATSTERKAVIDATMAAGARAAYVISEPVAAALGAEVPIANPAGNFIIDIGGGTTEIAVISLSGIVASNSVRVGGNKISRSIADYLRRQYSLAIGEQTADEIKHTIGSAVSPKKDLTMEVKGRDIASGLPQTVTLSSHEIVESLQDVLDKIMLAIRTVLEKTPPELVSDIVDRGLILTGGGAKLKNIDTLLSRTIGVPVIIADRPELCVALGTGIALENLEDYKKSLLAHGT